MFDNYYAKCYNFASGKKGKLIMNSSSMFVESAYKITSFVFNIGSAKNDVLDLVDFHIMAQLDFRLIYYNKFFEYCKKHDEHETIIQDQFDDMKKLYINYIFKVCGQSVKDLDTVEQESVSSGAGVLVSNYRSSFSNLETLCMNKLNSSDLRFVLDV